MDAALWPHETNIDFELNFVGAEVDHHFRKNRIAPRIAMTIS